MFIAQKLGRLCCAILAGAFISSSAAPRLAIQKQDLGVRIMGTTDDACALEAASNFNDWTVVQMYPAAGVPIDHFEPAALTRRFFRVRNLSLPVPLPDLGTLPNRVFIPNEGFNTVQFAPSGKLGFIIWRDRELVLRERSTGGGWTEQVVSSAGSIFAPRVWEEYRFQPFAALLYDSASAPRVFRVSGNSIVHSSFSSGVWSHQTINASAAGNTFVLFAAALGPADTIHFAIVNSTGAIYHGSNKSGPFVFAQVTATTGDPRGFMRQSYAPRFFSMAIDSANGAHLAFSPENKLTFTPYARSYSKLAYASDRGGSWSIESVSEPLDSSGDAGIGGSIALGPGDRPAIATWFNERVDTGSASWSRLQFHQRNDAGAWTMSPVLSRPDGYIAGDGEKGTGFAPSLRFDPAGLPHIIFSDHASQHFPFSGQDEFAGQIRHARYDGAQWRINTVFSQSNPMQRQMIYPSFAVSQSELVVMGLERQAIYGPDAWPRDVQSSYYFVWKSLPR